MSESLNVSQKINKIIKTFPLSKQQEVLNFVEFLQTKLKQKKEEQVEQKNVSFLDATREFAGCLDGGPKDLSTNKKYLEDLGKQ